MNPYDIAAQQAPQLLQNYGGPLGLAGKLLGLGKDEVEAGVPWWSWFGVGILAGGLVTYALRHKIEKIVE